MSSLPITMQATLGALVLTAAAYDIRFRRIPNWLVLTGFVAAIALSFRFFALQGLKASGLGAALAFCVYFPLFALRAVGAGDLKLMVAVAAFTGAYNWIVLFLITSLVGGVLAMVIVIHRGHPGRTFRNVLFAFGELLQFRAPYLNRPQLDVTHPKSARLPHGVSIAGGTLLFLAFEQIRQ